MRSFGWMLYAEIRNFLCFKNITSNFSRLFYGGTIFVFLMVGCSKSAKFFHAILCQINGISRANLTPLGGVFKIHDFFLHGFENILIL